MRNRDKRGVDDKNTRNPGRLARKSIHPHPWKKYFAAG